MDIKIKLLYFLFDLLMPLVAGYFCRRQRWLGDGAMNKMITLNILFIAPLLSILSFWALHLIAELVWLPVFGILVSIVPGLLAYALANRKYDSHWDQGSYVLSAALSNMGTVGGLSAFFLYGEAGFAYTQLITMFFNFMVFAVGFPVARYYYLKGESGEAYKPDILAMIFNWNQLPVVGLIIGVALSCFSVPRSPHIGIVFDPLVHISAWTMLVPVGYSIDFGEMRKYYRGIMDLIPIKFIVTPIVIYGLGKLVIGDSKVLNTLLVLASTPPAINSVITAKVHNLNVNVAMAAFILLTALYVFVVYPLLFLWITW